MKDLMDWRCCTWLEEQKPINVLGDEPRIELANQVSLSSAVSTSLLLLPETFREEELYREITSLSYRGELQWQWEKIRIRSRILFRLKATTPEAISTDSAVGSSLFVFHGPRRIRQYTPGHQSSCKSRTCETIAFETKGGGTKLV